MPRARLSCLVLLLCLVAAGCRQKKPRTAVIPMPPPKPATSGPPPALPPPPTLPPTDTQVAKTIDSPLPKLPGPPKPKRKPKVSMARQQEPAVGPRPVEPPADAPPANPPVKLSLLLTLDQQREYTQAIAQSCDHARRVADAARPRSLSDSQKLTLRQIDSFVAQALDLKSQDLEAAKSLAERADLLAQQLAKELK